MSIYEPVDKLRETGSSISAGALARLSNLTAQQLTKIRDTMSKIDVPERRHLVGRLTKLAEANALLDFTEIFKSYLDDSDGEVRSAAVAGLWEDEDPEIAMCLVAILKDDPEATVRAAAASCLAALSS